MAEQVEKKGDLEDWDALDRVKVATEFTLILKEAQNCNFTPEQLEEISEASVNLAAALGSAAGNEVPDELKDMLSGIAATSIGLTQEEENKKDSEDNDNIADLSDKDAEYEENVQSTPSNPGQLSASDVVGKWSYWDGSNSNHDIITINSNGTFVRDVCNLEEGEVILNGTWSLSNDKLVLKYDNGEKYTCGLFGDDCLDVDGTLYGKK